MNKVWKNVLSLTFCLGLTTSLTFSFGSLDASQTLKEKDRGAAVFELQRALGELGFFSESEFTNYYGNKTAEAVSAFQKSQKLSADGVSGKATLEALNDHLQQLRKTEALKAGSAGKRAAQLKADLKTLGYDVSAGDLIEVADASALKAFQTAEGLKADGVAGETTLEAITRALAAKLGYGSSGETAAALKAPAASKTTAPAATRGGEAVRMSKDFLGIAYKWGGSSSKGFDCSGFTVYIMKQYGISLPHSASAQYKHGKAVERSDLKEGDLLFFKTDDAPISHVGIYIGDGQFIHASSAKNKVIISSLKTYGGKYVGARRVL